MELLSLIAVMGGTLLGLVITAAVLLALWSRDALEKPLLLERVLRRQGDDVAHRALASGSQDFAGAVRQCLRCAEAAQCRAWLASGARQGYQWFCPNAGYIDRMRR
jgi:hypothetical protein